jgi:nucleoside-diphosphate-sugar epimerase
MVILITGTAGYLGAVTAAQLITRGHTVRGLDCLRWGGAALLGLYPVGGFTLMRADVSDRDAVADALDGVDAVVHLAAIVGDPACAAEPGLARQVNLDATVGVHQATVKAGIGRLVFASTCSVYGHHDGLADEVTVADPLSLYAQTKADAERYLLAADEGPATTVLRFATFYGLAPRMRFDLVVNKFTRQAVTEGRLSVFAPAAWRPYVHVADAAAAIATVLAAPAGRVGGQVFNVGATAENYQTARLADIVAGACGGDVAIDIAPLAGDARDYRVACDKLTATTGFAPARTVTSGVAEMAAALSAGVLDGETSRAAA